MRKDDDDDVAMMWWLWSGSPLCSLEQQIFSKEKKINDNFPWNHLIIFNNNEAKAQTSRDICWFILLGCSPDLILKKIETSVQAGRQHTRAILNADHIVVIPISTAHFTQLIVCLFSTTDILMLLMVLCHVGILIKFYPITKRAYALIVTSCPTCWWNK